MSSDPFSLVHNALWTLLERHKGFTDLVKSGNRIKFTGANRAPIKDPILTADLPEVRVTPVGGASQVQMTSSSTKVIKKWSVQVSTGDQRVDAVMFPVEWEILRALNDYVSTLTALQWNSKPFVKLCRVTDISEGVSQQDLNRGIKGWSVVWACEVQMWFDSSDLVAVTS